MNFHGVDVGPKKGALRGSNSSRKVLLIAAVLMLSMSAIASLIPLVHAVVTTNPTTATAGGESAYGSQRKVFYASGYWWIFWGSNSGVKGIYYQSSPDGVTWSAPATFTSKDTSSSAGTSFSAVLVAPDTLYYVLAPASGGLAFYYGAATLQATGTVAFTAQDFAQNLPAGRFGTSAPRASIAIGADGYITVAVTTDSSAGGAAPFYVDALQCQTAIGACNGGTWYTFDYKLSTGLVADLTTPTVVPLVSGGMNYVGLAFDDAKSAGGAPGYGVFDFFQSLDTAGSIAFTGPFSPFGPFYTATNYALAASGSTMYVVGTYWSGGTLSFSYPVGGPVSPENAIFGGAYTTSLAFSGGTLLMFLPTGNDVQVYSSANGGVTFGFVNYLSYLGTETGPAWIDASPTVYATTGAACPSMSCIGVMWEDAGVNHIRFAAYSLTNFPVTVTLAMNEYQTPVQTAWYPLNINNGFRISFTQCTAVGCASTIANSTLYGNCNSATGGCTTKSPSYGCATGASAGCYLTIPNVKSYTIVTIAATTTGSSGTEQWCVSINTNIGGACNVTQVGSSNGIPATETVGGVKTNNFPSYQYFDAFLEPSKYSIQPALPAPPRAPTMNIVGISNCANCGWWNQVPNMGLGTANYWMLKNSTDFASGSVSGAASDQWAANPGGNPGPGCGGGNAGGLAWTISSANQINCNIVYYHQYINVFTIKSVAGTSSFDGSGGFVIQGTQYGLVGAIATFVPSGVSTFGVDLWTDAATTATFPTSAIGTPIGTRWQVCPTYIAACPLAADMSTSTMTQIINTGVGLNPAGYTVMYAKQFSQTFQYQVSDGTSLPVGSTPTINFNWFATANSTTLTMPSQQQTIWMDATTSATLTPQTKYNGGAERWTNATASWTISAYNIIASPSGIITYYHQFEQPVSYTTSDASVPTGGAPKVSYVNNGSALQYTLTGATKNIWMDATTTATVPNPICNGGCGAAVEQWTTTPYGPASWQITASNIIDPASGNIEWQHQFTVTFQAVPASEGSVIPNGMNLWEPANSFITVTATPLPGYSFSGWSATLGVTITLPATNNPDTIMITAGGQTVTGNFLVVSGLVFMEVGLNLGVPPPAPSWFVTITAAPGGFVCPTGPGLPCVLTITAQTDPIPSAPVGVYTYTVQTPVNWQPSGCNGPTCDLIYLYSGVACPCTVNVNPTGTATVSFTAYYLLSWDQNPVGAGTVLLSMVSGSTCLSGPNATSVYCPAGNVMQLTESPTAPNSFIDWTRVVCNEGQISTTCTLNMNQYQLPVANFHVTLTETITFNPQVGNIGSQVSTPVTAYGGFGTITFSTSPLPAGITVNFINCNPPGCPATVGGTTVTMLVTIAPTAPFGLFSWFVIANDTGTPQQIVPVKYTLQVVAPAVTNVGFSKTAFAIEFPSQSALFYFNNHWYVIYSDGNDLVYRQSTDNLGTSWSGADVLVAGVAEGYSFAVNNTGSSVFFVYIPPTFSNGFEFIAGNIDSAACSLTNGICWNSPVYKSLGALNTIFTAGSPTLMIDNVPLACQSPPPACVWVTIPIVDSSLNWHVYVLGYTSGLWKGPVDIPLKAAFTGTNSQGHGQLFPMTDGVAIMFSVGNTPVYTRVTVVDRISLVFTNFCPKNGTCPPDGLWGKNHFFEQQSQVVVGRGLLNGDTLYYAGLACTTANACTETGAGNTYPVEFFTFTYYPAGGPCGTDGCFSSPSQIATIGVVSQNALINHSWHITLLNLGSSLFISWGVDGNLWFAESGDGGVTWPNPIQVLGAVSVVGGLTATSSSNGVGLIWVESVGTRYVVKFSVV